MLRTHAEAARRVSVVEAHTHESTRGEWRLGAELQSQASARKRVAALVTGGAGRNEQRECGGVRGAGLTTSGWRERGAHADKATDKQTSHEGTNTTGVQRRAQE